MLLLFFAERGAQEAAETPQQQQMGSLHLDKSIDILNPEIILKANVR